MFEEISSYLKISQKIEYLYFYELRDNIDVLSLFNIALNQEGLRIK